MKVIRILLVSAIIALAGPLSAGDTSEASFVFLAPKASSFWHTATGRTMTLPIDWPDSAASATLVVTGTTYRAAYEVTGDSFSLTLPEATEPANEDVYELTLTFDDGTVRTARLGLVAGLADGAEGSTRCVFNANLRKWRRAAPHAVMPVPAGTTAFAIDGVAVEEGDAGFTGAQGWYALPNLAVGTIVPVSLTAGGLAYNASLEIGYDPGLAVIVK